MKHCILAKWNETVTDKAALLAQVRALYTAADDIPGVHSVTVHPCCIDRPNRYNLMIVLDMDREALPNWDASTSTTGGRTSTADCWNRRPFLITNKVSDTPCGRNPAGRFFVTGFPAGPSYNR